MQVSLDLINSLIIFATLGVAFAVLYPISPYVRSSPTMFTKGISLRCRVAQLETLAIVMGNPWSYILLNP